MIYHLCLQSLTSLHKSTPTLRRSQTSGHHSMHSRMRRRHKMLTTIRRLKLIIYSIRSLAITIQKSSMMATVRTLSITSIRRPRSIICSRVTSQAARLARCSASTMTRPLSTRNLWIYYKHSKTRGFSIIRKNLSSSPTLLSSRAIYSLTLLLRQHSRARPSSLRVSSHRSSRTIPRLHRLHHRLLQKYKHDSQTIN